MPENFFRKIKLVLLMFFILPFISFAQNWADPNGTIRSQLISLIQSRYGPSFQSIQFSVLDTLISYSERDNENIQDPYGTLKGCILFSTYSDYGASIPDTFIVGIVRNNTIIWDNAPGTSADLGGDLLCAQDINKDGEVDLIFSESDPENQSSGMESSLYYFYILSWNGTSGRFINAFRVDGKSALMGDGSLDIVDKNGDDIQALKTILPEVEFDWENYRTSTYPYITYGFNGSQYGFWSSTAQIAGNEFLPANRITASVKCYIQKINNTFQYNYEVSSDSSSKQIISDIYIGGLDDTTSTIAPTFWESGSSSYIGGRAFIKYSHGTFYLIHPGQTVGGFKTISPVLPCIVKYYIQGYTPPVFNSSEEEKRNIYNNSVTGYTLGTSDTNNYFLPSHFIDTISNYTTQSRELGWIKNQPTANKYLAFCTLAKNSLQSNDITTTRNLLQQILHDVDIDSTDNITSEAYALLRYNTEYLLNHLESAFIKKSFAPGWNMSSVPFIQSNYNAGVVFPGCFGDVFKFDNAAGGYSSSPILANGWGYWVYYTDTSAINITGAVISNSITVPCGAGWNLIGSREVPITTSTLTVNAGRIFGDLFRFKPLTGEYLPTPTIYPGEAVWVYVTEPCTLTIP